MIHHWDFFGIDSLKTAEHFKKHLDQFLSSASMTALQSGYFHADKGHTCIWLDVGSDEHSKILSQRLKPQRSLSGEEHALLIAKLEAAARAESL